MLEVGVGEISYYDKNNKCKEKNCNVSSITRFHICDFQRKFLILCVCEEASLEKEKKKRTIKYGDK